MDKFKHLPDLLNKKSLRTLFVITLALLSACATIDKGSTVYVENALRGSNPYAGGNASAPSSWFCNIKPGAHVIEEANSKLNIVKIDNCWVSADINGLSTKPAKSTSTPYPTPNVWATMPSP